MLIVIALIVIFVILYLIIIDKMHNSKNDNIRHIDYESCDDDYNMMFILFLDGLMLIICIIIIICVQFNFRTELIIKNNEITYQSLLDRAKYIDTEYENISKSEIIKDIAEWNRYVNNKKFYSNSLFTKWFFNKKITDNLNNIDIQNISREVNTHE